MLTKLTELNPSWCSSGGEGVYTQGEFMELIPKPLNEHAAIEFDCPCGCGIRRIIPVEKGHGNQWHIQNDNYDFSTLTLTPSIQVKSGCNTHFSIRDGMIIP